MQERDRDDETDHGQNEQDEGQLDREKLPSGAEPDRADSGRCDHPLHGRDEQGRHPADTAQLWPAQPLDQTEQKKDRSQPDLDEAILMVGQIGPAPDGFQVRLRVHAILLDWYRTIIFGLHYKLVYRN